MAEWLSFKNQYDYTGEGELEKVVALASNKVGIVLQSASLALTQNCASGEQASGRPGVSMCYIYHPGRSCGLLCSSPTSGASGLHLTFLWSCFVLLPWFSLTQSDQTYEWQANFPAAQVDRFCNLVRFMDLLQHTVDPDQIFPRITVLRPAFQPPAPVIAAAKVNTCFAGASATFILDCACA